MKNNEKPNILFPLLHFLGLACLLISCDSTPGQQPGKTSLVSSDDSDLFLFTNADGETYSFSFNSHHFEHGRTQYELSGDAALWRLADDLRTQDKTLEGR